MTLWELPSEIIMAIIVGGACAAGGWVGLAVLLEHQRHELLEKIYIWTIGAALSQAGILWAARQMLQTKGTP